MLWNITAEHAYDIFEECILKTCFIWPVLCRHRWKYALVITYNWKNGIPIFVYDENFSKWVLCTVYKCTTGRKCKCM